MAFDYSNKTEEAIYYFKKAIEKDPKDVSAYTWLGLTLSKDNKMDSALESLQKAI